MGMIFEEHIYFKPTLDLLGSEGIVCKNNYVVFGKPDIFSLN